MNNVKLCGLVVMLCVLAPVCTGYVWPVEAGTDTIYEVGYQTNISKDVYNADVPIFSDFTGAFENNWNYFWDDDGNMEWAAEATNFVASQKPSAIPSSTYAEQSDYQKYYTSDATGTYSIDPTDFETWVSTNYPGVVNYWAVTLDAKNWDYINAPYWKENDDGTFTAVMVECEALIYYVNSGLFFGITLNNHYLVSIPSPYGIYFEGTPSTSIETTVRFNTLDPNNLLYADLNSGFRIQPVSSGGTAFWANGYVNNSIDILFELHPENKVALNVGDSNDTIQVRCDSYGDIDILTPYDFQALGNISQFPYVLLSINAYTNKVSLTGLMGMSGFLDNYQQHKRATITLDMDIDKFRTITMINTGSWVYGSIAYYVPYSNSGVTSTPGISGTNLGIVYLDVKDYTYSTGSGQIQFRNFTLWPEHDIINLYNNGNLLGTMQFFENGNFEYEGLDGIEVEGNIKNLIFSCIEKRIYINGVPIKDDSTPIVTFQLRFYGDWLGQIYYSDITPETVDTYGWMPGGFGLDVSGFCMTGLIASSGSGIACMLYGRRSGGKALLVGITATICAAVYLCLMMTF